MRRANHHRRTTTHRRSNPWTLLLATLVSFASLATLTPGVAAAAAGFGDIEDNAFYTDAIAWMVGEEITTGIELGCFGPEIDVTRGQIAAFLYRLELSQGNRPIAASHPFGDVVADYQQAPVAWMYQQGITTGVSPSSFEPDRSMTRGDFAVLLWRYAGEPVPTSTAGFTDVRAAYQMQAINWMAAEGITTGTTPSSFSPDTTINRAEAATFLYRFVDPGPVVATADATVSCTRELRLTLESVGFTPTEASCAVPFLVDFELEDLLAVVEDRATASFELIVAAVGVANNCLGRDRVADFSRIFL